MKPRELRPVCPPPSFRKKSANEETVRNRPTPSTALASEKPRISMPSSPAELKPPGDTGAPIDRPSSHSSCEAMNNFEWPENTRAEAMDDRGLVRDAYLGAKN